MNESGFLPVRAEEVSGTGCSRKIRSRWVPIGHGACGPGCVPNWPPADRADLRSDSRRAEAQVPTQSALWQGCFQRCCGLSPRSDPGAGSPPWLVPRHPRLSGLEGSSTYTFYRPNRRMSSATSNRCSEQPLIPQASCQGLGDDMSSVTTPSSVTPSRLPTSRLAPFPAWTICTSGQPSPTIAL